MSKRAIRRHHKNRLKQRVRRIAKNNWASDERIEQMEDWLKRCEQLADHLQCCQSRCCANPRNWDGPPIQEIREFQRYNDLI